MDNRLRKIGGYRPAGYFLCGADSRHLQFNFSTASRYGSADTGSDMSADTSCSGLYVR